MTDFGINPGNICLSAVNPPCDQSHHIPMSTLRLTDQWSATITIAGVFSGLTTSADLTLVQLESVGCVAFAFGPKGVFQGVFTSTKGKICSALLYITLMSKIRSISGTRIQDYIVVYQPVKIINGHIDLMLNGLERSILSIFSPSSNPTSGSSTIIELEIEHAFTCGQTGSIDAIVSH